MQKRLPPAFWAISPIGTVYALCCMRAEQSRAEQSRGEQRRAEQGTDIEDIEDGGCLVEERSQNRT